MKKKKVILFNLVEVKFASIRNTKKNLEKFNAAHAVSRGT